VGDRLDTDIEFANSANFLSCLVLTGCTSADDVLAELRSSGGFDMKGMNTSNVIGPLPNTTSSKLPTVVTASLEELTNKYLQVP
jgi:ribonucleotide monophosphatase NagD (HAD superfamily)